MGFTPREVDRMTLWEFLACLDGYAEAQGGKRRSAEADIEDADLRAWGIKGF